jgi:hypothetical protein
MEQKSQIPEEVINLNKMVQKLSAFKLAVSEATFQGKKAKVVDDLLMHLHEEYLQVFEKFNNHPFVIAQLEAQEKQHQEDLKLAAELEQEMQSKMEIK